MGAEHFAGVLDRAEILLGARHNLADVGDQSSAVGTVGAMEFLDEVQVFELLPIEHDVVAASHLGYPVDREARRLIEADEEIEDDERDDHAVNDRPGKQVLWAVCQQPMEKSRLESAVSFHDGMLELDLLALNLEEQTALLVAQRVAQLFLKCAHLVD